MKKDLVEKLVEHQHDMNFFLDSGAFTAFKSGKPIQLDTYCRFLESLPVKPWRYFMLDVIGDHKATMANYETMLKRGFNPVPVFTPGQPMEDIERYYETSDLIGFGGIAGAKNTAKTLGYIKLLMRHAKGRNVHLLGYTGLENIKYFKPYSCDSSSWSSAARFGSLPIYLGNGKLELINREKLLIHPKPEWVKALNGLGLTMSYLQKRENWISTRLQDYGLRSWVALSKDVEKNLKTKMFLAIGGSS